MPRLNRASCAWWAMDNAEQPPKRGRPRKEAPACPPNVADVSLELIHAHKAAIGAVMCDFPALKAWAAQAAPSDRAALLDALAHEVAFFPAMLNLVQGSPRGKTGPKPKTEQALMLAQVRSILAGASINLPQWKNGRAQRTSLAEFCERLIQISGHRAIISTRTTDNAPSRGWEPLG